MLQEPTLRRRHFARILESVIATSALVTIASLPTAAMGQSPSCGIEQPNPTCGVESPDPSCGCESPLMRPSQTAPTKGPVCFRPRSLSFAEKFLKHLDRVGDQVEWEAARKSALTCSCGACDVSNAGGPSCGCESPYAIAGTSMPSCGCGPSVPFGMPIAMPRNGAGTNGAQPFVNNSGRAGQGGQSGFSANTAPMFPNIPKESQAIGKISDSGTVKPRTEKPVAAPATQPNLNKSRETSNSEKAIKQETPPTIPSAGLPRTTNNSAVDQLPVLQPTPTEDRSALPSESPAPTLPPSLPESQDEIPDVLIDPFKDDASWKGNRNRLNGVRLTSGESPNPLRTKSSVPSESKPKLLPTPHNDDGLSSPELPPVLVKPSVINRYRSDAAEPSPKVNRVAVPKKRD
ncbi:MAG: hypothetical protein MUC83_12645 [Pirellula sp.]|nr:hypothetical protein [Pirellula sp.]